MRRGITTTSCSRVEPLPGSDFERGAEALLQILFTSTQRAVSTTGFAQPAMMN
jgi:hypothetical protein